MPGKKFKANNWMTDKIQWFNLTQKFPALIDKEVYEKMSEEDILAFSTFSRIQDIHEKQRQTELDLRSKRKR